MLEVGVVDVLEDEGRGSRDGVLDDTLQGDDVGAAAKVLQDLDLALDLLLLDRLQRFDDALLVVRDVDGLEHLAVLATAQLPDKLLFKIKYMLIFFSITSKGVGQLAERSLPTTAIRGSNPKIGYKIFRTLIAI